MTHPAKSLVVLGEGGCKLSAGRNRRGRPSADETKERKLAVFNAARAEFIAKGYRAATMDDIARRAGVSKRTLYCWHEDKAALFHACIVEGARELPLPPFGHDEGLEAGLFRFTCAAMLAVTNQEAFGMAALMMREGHDFPEFHVAIEHGRAFMVDPIVQALSCHGVPPGHAPRLARFFLSMAFANLQDRIIFGLEPMTAPEIEEDVRHATETFIHGISRFLPSPDANRVL